MLVIVACGDDPVTSAGDASTGSTGLATTTAVGPVPTTSSPTSSDDATGTGTGAATGTTGTTSTTSPITSDTSTGPLPTTDDPDTTATTIVDPGTSTTTADTTTTTADTTTTTSDTTTTGGCASPGDCPAPPGDCFVAACDAGVCGQEPAPQDTPCVGGVCDDQGACVGCNQPADCPPPSNTCVVHDCVAHECAEEPLSPGAPCDGGVCSLGQCVDCIAAADCPPPPGACVMAACAANSCGATPVPQGTPCPGGVCDDQGACVACNVDADCPNQQLCQDNQCVPPPANCMDGLKNGSETDTDCGGSCPPCQDGDTCLVDGDCISDVCDNNVCGVPVPACVNSPLDPATGQRCPLFMACTQSSECGVVQQGCQQWFCNNNTKTCELNALVGCWTDVGGLCNADVVFTQQTLPPVAKRFVPPDGVNFRELASLVFTVKNNTATDLYLDKLPLLLDVTGGGSKFDVSSVKIFDNSGGSEHGGGDILVCLTADPFSFPANGTMGPCAGSAFSRVPKNGGTNQFLINVAFAANKTFINGRGYRLRMPSTAGIQFKNGFNGPLFAGTTCGVPNEGYTGAWVTAQTP